VRRASAELDELVDGVRERRDDAFSVVYRLTASGLVSYAYGMLRDRPAAEDAVQQAFLELARSAPAIRGDGRSLRAWLYKSVRFGCLDEIRRRERHPETPTATLPDRGLVDELELPDPALRAALLTLNERQRSLIVLRHVVGLSGEEVARVVGIPRTAVYAAVARAERRLKKELEAIESAPSAASQPVTPPDDRPGGP
jgi:RNA polymerase sigma-70 factor (ECF subfamily)